MLRGNGSRGIPAERYTESEECNENARRRRDELTRAAGVWTDGDAATPRTTHGAPTTNDWLHHHSCAGELSPLIYRGLR